MSLGGAEEIRDGRVRRGARNREAIVEALFELIGEGTIQPTAEQVAERAGVRVRTVFRHFDDMAGLMAELDRRIRVEVMPLLQWEPTGDVESRTRELVHHRIAAFERAAPYKRAGDAQRWRRDYLQTQHENLVRQLRQALFVVLPELREAPSDVQAAFELVVSWEAWTRLRLDQNLGIERARAAMECAALAVVARLDR